MFRRKPYTIVEGMAADVVMYRTRVCPYCVLARRLLLKKGAQLREVDVSRDHAQRRWLFEATRRRTVPQIFINQQPIGGYDELRALERRGLLDELLASPT